MKKKLLLALSALVLFVMVGCSTAMVPISANTSFPSDGKYEILGRVSISSEQLNSGFSKLLDEAKNVYPEADDVVNIMVDAKQKTFFFMTTNTYEMTGIAIKYKD